MFAAPAGAVRPACPTPPRPTPSQGWWRNTQAAVRQLIQRSCSGSSRPRSPRPARTAAVETALTAARWAPWTVTPVEMAAGYALEPGPAPAALALVDGELAARWWVQPRSAAWAEARGRLLLAQGAAAWVLAADGPVVRPAVAVATVAVALALAWTSGAGALRRGPALWLAAMLAWAALDAVLRPVAAYDAARVLAAGVVALALLLVVARPRAAAWGRLAVVAGGACAAAWMVAERAAHAARPAGPFGNPNGSATAALLGLALAPSLGLPLGVRVPLMALAAAGVVASGSRAALIGACVVAAAWGFAGRRRRGLALAAGLVAAVAVLGLAFRFVRDRDPLRYERLRIWGVVARVAAATLARRPAASTAPGIPSDAGTA